MSFEFTGAFSIPSLQTLLETYENTFWWDRYENQIWTGVVLSGASRDSGKSSHTDVLRPGLLLGRVSSTNKVKEWNPAATDGSEEIFGVLGPAAKMQRLGVNQDRFLGQIMVGGMVKAERLIVPGSAGLGISGNVNEWLIRSQMNGRFIFNDDLVGLPYNFGGWRKISAKTDADSPVTVAESDNNTLFTNKGSAGAVTFTLPTTAKVGLRYGFYVVADQSVTIASGTADKMVVFNDAAADSVSLSTAGEKVGAMFEVLGDGDLWYVIPHLWEGQTPTIAT